MGGKEGGGRSKERKVKPTVAVRVPEHGKMLQMRSVCMHRVSALENCLQKDVSPQLNGRGVEAAWNKNKGAGHSLHEHSSRGTM